MIKNYKITIIRHICQIIYLGIFLAALVSKNTVFMFATVSAILLGSIFCGWFCIFGLFQDLARYLGSFIKKNPIEFDYRYHKIFSLLRYFILIGTVFVGGIFLFPDEIKHSFIVLLKGKVHINLAFWAVGFVAILSLFSKRFFCRYLCPMGAKRGLFSLVRPLTVKRNAEECVGCESCSRACLMHIEIHKANDLANPNCIDCFRCVDSCPKRCISFGLRNYTKP